MGAIFKSRMKLVRSTHGNIDESLRHYRVRPLNTRQLS